MKKQHLFLASLCTLALFSCEPQDPTDPHDEELITTLNIDLTNSGTTLELNYQDIDGDGGDAPVITVDTLAANTTYTGTITLFNESEDPSEELTSEIFDEAEEHQFFFSSTGATTFAYSDQDNDGNPIGLSFTLTTSDAGSESYTVILRHEPEKTATGVSGGDITNAGGETDIEVVFDVTVE